jgi:serine/threonine-protein kinase
LVLAAGARLGPYEILSLLGAGGMGEVYRARDTKLGRDVALKILPQVFASDADRLARFTREAQTLAALNHPNIAHIHGLEESGGVRALVMELVDGEDLAQRLLRGPIPVDEALPIARQIAEALEAAHEQGIIHRDLKPANIKVRDDGTVKVLDFGLAKALAGDVTGSASGAGPLANLPTLTSPAMLTGVGVILGTAAYMAPEQAKGRPADRRSDIWAFGCVLYEMLTGTRAFKGEDVSDTMASLLTREPSWDRLPGTTHPAVRLLVQRCLRKEKRQRLQDATGVRIELEDAASAPVGTGSALSDGGRSASWRTVLVAGVALLGSAVVAGLAVWNLKPSPVATPQTIARLAVTVPSDEELLVPYPGVALSPNGAHMVYVAKRRGVEQLQLRTMDRLQSRALMGTEGARAPFFSPDGQWVGFFADGKLKKISVTGGASQIVCDAPGGRALGGSWAPNNVIFFASGGLSGLWQVSATGGTPHAFTTFQDGEISHRWPQVLPGGQAVLFTSRTGPGSDERQVQVQRVSSGERRMLAQGESGYYIPTGHLVYVQITTGTLVAVPFDLTRLQVGATAPVAAAEGILVGGEGAHYTWSGNGLLAYVAGRAEFDDRTLVWVNRHGKAEPANAPRRPYQIPRISPDGLQVAVVTSGPKFDIWVHTLARGDANKLITDGSSQFPIWTPDGRRLTYRATRAGTRNLFWSVADGGGTEERLTSAGDLPGSWSPDGQVLLFTEQTETRDILALKLSDRSTQPFLRTRFSEGAPRFSPDGRWVAYLSDESGRLESYVRPYPGPGRKWQISTDGATEPLWNPNGRELFYRNGNKVMVVDIATDPVFTVGKPALLFTGDYLHSSTGDPNYDVSRDGQRFLMVQPSARENATPTQIIVVLNWHEELKRLVPTK